MKVTFNKERIYREHIILVCPYEDSEIIRIIPKKGLPIEVSYLGIHFNGNQYVDTTNNFANLIPGLTYCDNSTWNSGWEFSKVIDLSKVADKLINLCVFLNGIEAAKEAYIKNLFA